MNVDVSPDGARVVFDLLGDLYVMPIGGSTAAAPATRLTTGPAFDMQPRFSPDGKRIAFTSDRGGLFNICDGRRRHEPTAVSREEKRWVNSPTWRRTVTSSSPASTSSRRGRSAPARCGCITAAGADGVQVTEKVSFRRTPGAGASPDGKFLYYSKDVTPSPTFEHDRTRTPASTRSSAVSWRRARAIGIVGGAGAITPRVSPDGSGWRSSGASTHEAASCSSAASRPAPSGRSSPT
jgi:Tol biopolymer transport system component